MLNQKHSTIPATRKKINSIAAKTRTPVKISVSAMPKGIWLKLQENLGKSTGILYW